MEDKPTQGDKKPYVKPKVEQIALRPVEAVLGACKAAGMSGPHAGNCAIPFGCSTSGS